MLAKVLPVFISPFLFSDAAFVPSDYTSVVGLSDDYTLHHRVENDILYVALQVHTTGYVGFGFANCQGGRLSGSDVVSASVDGSSGALTVTDQYIEWTPFPREVGRYAPAYPKEDDSQDWTAEGGEERDGWTVVELSRKLDTWDDIGDHIVGSGKVPVVWSFGDREIPGFGGWDTNNGVATVTFFSDAVVDEENTPADGNSDLFLPLTTPSHTIPVKKHVYWCMAHKLGPKLSEKVHGVKFNVELEGSPVSNTGRGVQQVTAWTCPTDGIPDQSSTPPPPTSRRSVSLRP